MVAALAQMVAALAQIVVRLAQMVVRLAHRNDPLPLVPDASENEMTLRKQSVLLPFHAQRALISIFSLKIAKILADFLNCFILADFC